MNEWNYLCGRGRGGGRHLRGITSNFRISALSPVLCSYPQLSPRAQPHNSSIIHFPINLLESIKNANTQNSQQYTTALCSARAGHRHINNVRSVMAQLTHILYTLQCNSQIMEIKGKLYVQAPNNLTILMANVFLLAFPNRKEGTIHSFWNIMNSDSRDR